MEQGAGYAGGDRDQVALAGEHFDLAGAGEFGEIDGTSGTDASGTELVSSDAGQLREEFARVDEDFM